MPIICIAAIIFLQFMAMHSFLQSNRLPAATAEEAHSSKAQSCMMSMLASRHYGRRLIIITLAYAAQRIAHQLCILPHFILQGSERIEGFHAILPGDIVQLVRIWVTALQKQY